MAEPISRPKLIVRISTTKIEKDSASPPPGIASGIPLATPSTITSAAIGGTTPRGGTPRASLPPVSTPAPPPRKIILKKRTTVPSTPTIDTPMSGLPFKEILPRPAQLLHAEPQTTMPARISKSGRGLKPTAKRQLQQDDSDEENEVGTNQIRAPPTKRVRIKTTSTSSKPTGAPRRLTLKDNKPITPNRHPGDGYDSELEDVETDPQIEEQIIFRMMEGVENDYLRSCLDARKYPGSGMDFKIRWVDERRACVIVKSQHYAAVLVDLPTITESMKTWDRKAMVKTADICQMLLVYSKVDSEADAKTAELPKAIFDGHRWPHGLTPPMHDCVHRRFRKRLSKKEILDKEAEVERLIAADRNAISTEAHWVDERQGTRDESSEEEDGEEDADGEEDDGTNGDVTGFDDGEADDDLEAELWGELEEVRADETAKANAAGDTPVDGTPAATSGGNAAANTPVPAVAVEQEEAEEDDDDDSGDEVEDDSDEDSDEEIDDAERDRREAVRGVRAEIKEISGAIANFETKLAVQTNPILQKKLRERMQALKSEKALKLAQIGEEEDDGQEEVVSDED